MNSTAASWRVSSTRTSESCGSPALARPSRSAAAMAMFDRIAPDDPRRKRGVPGLEAEAERVAGDVGAVLVDDRHHAERHTHPVDAQPVRAHPPVRDLADRIGQTRDGAQAVGHRHQPGVGEPQAVDHGRRPTVGTRRPPRHRRWRRGSRRGDRGAGPRRPAGAASFTSVDAVASTRLAALARAPSSAMGSRGTPEVYGAGARPSHPDPGPGGRLSPWARHQRYGRPPPRPGRHGRGVAARRSTTTPSCSGCSATDPRVRCATPARSSPSKVAATSSTGPSTRSMVTLGRPTGTRPGTGSRRS